MDEIKLFNQMKILYTGDVDLGMPLPFVSPEKREEFKRALTEGFCRTVNAEIADGVELVIIFGSLFACAGPSPEDVDLVLSLFSDNPDVTFIICPGDADCACPLYSKSVLPFNVKVFTSQNYKKQEVKLKGVCVYGAQKPKAGAHGDIKIEDNGLLNILLMHESGKKDDNISDTVKDSGADLCLINRKTKSKPIKEGKTAVIRTGRFSPDGFFHEGHGTYGIVSATDTKDGWELKTEQKEYSGQIYISLTLDVTGKRTVREVEEATLCKMAELGYGENVSLRITYVGDVYYSLIIPKSFDSVQKNLAYLEIINDTLPLFECEKLKKEATVPGELLRKLYLPLTSDSRAKRLEAARTFRMAYLAVTEKGINDF